jgi:hypothetical protein
MNKCYGNYIRTLCQEAKLFSNTLFPNHDRMYTLLKHDLLMIRLEQMTRKELHKQM